MESLVSYQTLDFIEPIDLLVQAAEAFRTADIGMEGEEERKVDPYLRVSTMAKADEWTLIYQERLEGLEGLPPLEDLIFYDHEILHYLEGGHIETHVDRERPLKDGVHVGTLLLISLTPGSKGGFLEVKNPEEPPMFGRKKEEKLRPEPGEESLLLFLPLAVPHKVTALTKGQRVVLKAAVAIRKEALERDVPTNRRHIVRRNRLAALRGSRRRWKD